MAGRVGPLLGLADDDIGLVALAIEGSTYGLLGTFLPQLQKRRVLVASGDRAYLVSLNVWLRPRDILWRGSLSEIRVVKGRWRSSTADVGGHRVFLPAPNHRLLNEALGS